VAHNPSPGEKKRVATFLRAATEICVRTSEQEQRLDKRYPLGPSSSDKLIAEAFDAYGSMVEGLDAPFSKLDPPSAQRKPFTRLRRQYRELAQRFHDVAAARRTGDIQRSVQLMESLSKVGEASDKTALQLGLDECTDDGGDSSATSETQNSGIVTADQIAANEIGTNQLDLPSAVTAGVLIIPFGNAAQEASQVRKAVLAELGITATIAPAMQIPEEAIERTRKQVDGSVLAKELLNGYKRLPRRITLIGVTRIDMFNSEQSYNYVVGLRDVGAGFGLVSTGRLRYPLSTGSQPTSGDYNHRVQVYVARLMGAVRYGVDARPIEGAKTSVDGLFSPVVTVTDLDPLKADLCPYRSYVTRGDKREIRCP
jgi:predicted Zn-dependent protease